MTTIKEILQLPKTEQVAILEAIQDNIDDFENDSAISEEHIAFIKERIESIESAEQKTYSWQEVKERLNDR